MEGRRLILDRLKSTVAVALIGLIAACTSAMPAPAQRDSVSFVVLDRRGVGAPVYRIPALARTTRGTLLAVYDARPGLADLPGSISLVVRRSTDNGRSWSNRQTIRAGSTVSGFGDASLLVDRKTGTILLFHAASMNVGFFNSRVGNVDTDSNILHMDVSTSHDDGKTWTHRRLTSHAKHAEWSGVFATSGEGIQLRRGPFAGRLLQQYVVRVEGKNYGASLVSDDDGSTWRFGNLVGPGVDENKAVELADGSLMLNARAKPYRLIARSIDGGLSWQELHADSQLIDPANNASIIRVSDDPRASVQLRSLLFVNTADSTRRTNLTLRRSCDEGRTWPVSRTLVHGAAGYATMTMLPDGMVGVLFEHGDYDGMTFARVRLDWIGTCS